jgi:hypothetical protein
MALAGALVALLAAARFSVVGLWTDLLLSAGFLIGSLSTVAFAVIPVLNGGSLEPADAWAALLGSIAAQGLIAIAPFLGGRVRVRERALRDTVIAAGVVLVFAWLVFRAHGSGLPALTAVPGVRAAPPGLVSGAPETTWPGGSPSASRSSSSRRSISCSHRCAGRPTSPRGTSCA